MDKVEVDKAIGYIQKLHKQGHQETGDCQIAACIVVRALLELMRAEQDG